jgi:hypothetical protein
MRQIDSSMMNEEGKLVLLTSRDIADDSKFMAADFRDMQAFIYNPTGSWIGADMQGIKLGKGPLNLINGIWYTDLDEELNRKHQHVRLSAELISFEMIR